MQVRQIMSSPVVTVDVGATLRDAVGEMLDRGVGSVVVVDAGPVGIVTRTDALRETHRGDGSLSAVPVTRAMNRDLVTTTEKASVTSALEEMKRHEVKRLPVRDGVDLVGIVTVTDVARHQPQAVNEVRRHLGSGGWRG
ncbi:CBS domain-containing protein [Halogeometricum sp. S1BR25-6]|uniref:CBS domain-containing protein n=1 Tax=Halogeometricum salsisoli TaxID=2950536 RepID=A0ABU2GDM4_9EURY|nr:CBS domain-containing protein [Halogeometricum sp. S1BR25-6]MDS0298566.1 CBS domain-containing protein [Halogeometricum sp. S1BR25-6]